jgi:hypothetical protein
MQNRFVGKPNYREGEAWHLAGLAVAGSRLCDHALFLIIRYTVCPNP